LYSKRETKVPKFLTQQWVRFLFETLNKDAEYAEGARDFEGRVLIEVQPSQGFLETSYLYLDVADGKCREAKLIKDLSSVKADYTFSGTYSKWIKILTRKTDLNQALLSGELGLKAEAKEKRKLWTKHLRANYMLGNCMTKIPTEFV